MVGQEKEEGKFLKYILCIILLFGLLSEHCLYSPYPGTSFPLLNLPYGRIICTRSGRTGARNIYHFVSIAGGWEGGGGGGGAEEAPCLTLYNTLYDMWQQSMWWLRPRPPPHQSHSPCYIPIDNLAARIRPFGQQSREYTTK